MRTFDQSLSSISLVFCHAVTHRGGALKGAKRRKVGQAREAKLRAPLLCSLSFSDKGSLNEYGLRFVETWMQTVCSLLFMPTLNPEC